jgi:uncharacterized protein (DUF4415 family)
MLIDDKPLPASKRRHHHYLFDAMTRLEWDLQNSIAIKGRIPREWHRISAERDHSKTRITIRLDKDVLKFFRSMGPGYQPRINQVLRAFMHAKLMGVLEGDDTLDRFREQEMGPFDARPEWGTHDRMWEKVAEKKKRREAEGK